jgi:hypothetical protein
MGKISITVKIAEELAFVSTVKERLFAKSAVGQLFVNMGKERLIAKIAVGHVFVNTDVKNKRAKTVKIQLILH